MRGFAVVAVFLAAAIFAPHAAHAACGFNQYNDYICDGGGAAKGKSVNRAPPFTVPKTTRPPPASATGSTINSAIDYQAELRKIQDQIAADEQRLIDAMNAPPHRAGNANCSGKSSSSNDYASPGGGSGGTTYYVASCGGGGDGKSEGSPLCSLDQVNKLALKPGDRVLFKAGDVFEGSLRPTSGGAEGNPVYFGSYGSGPPPKITNTFFGIFAERNWLTFDGLEVSGTDKGVTVSADHITLTNLTVSDIKGECVGIHTDAHYIIVENSDISHCGVTSNGEGIYIGQDPAKWVPDGWTTTADVLAHAVSNVVVRNNNIHDLHDEGVEVKMNAYNITIEGNTLTNVASSNGAIHVSQWYDIPPGGLHYAPHAGDPPPPPPGWEGNVIVSNNQLSGGVTGIRMKAAGEVTGNTVSGFSGVGLRVGDPRNGLPIVVNNNQLSNNGTNQKIDGNSNNIVSSGANYTGANGDIPACTGDGGS